MKNALTTMQHNSNQQVALSVYETFLALPVDTSLTLRTAEQQGYVWSGDVGLFSPEEVIKLVIRLVRDKGYKIGQARIMLFDRRELSRGLYKPLPKKRDGSKAKRGNALVIGSLLGGS